MNTSRFTRIALPSLTLSLMVAVFGACTGEIGSSVTCDLDGTCVEIVNLQNDAQDIDAADDEGAYDEPLETPQPELLSADDEPVAEAKKSAGKRVSFAGDNSEARYGVHIHDAKHKKPKVIYTVKLKDLTTDERLKLRGEVTLSFCGRKDRAGLSGDAAVTPCSSNKMFNHPYTYTPYFSAAFVINDSPTSAHGKRVSAWHRIKCSDNRHHCALALPESTVTNVPNAETKFVHLVVSADAGGANAKSWHVMEVEHHHGRLGVTRLSPEAQRIVHAANDKLRVTNKMGVDQTPDEGDNTQVRRVMYRQKLTGLKPGDVVSSDAHMVAKLGAGDCHPLVTSFLMLTKNEGAVNQKKKRGDKLLTTRNGSNCTKNGSGTCDYVESGAVKVPDGAPSTLYVNYVAQAARSCAPAGGKLKWWVADGAIRVNVHR